MYALVDKNLIRVGPRSYHRYFFNEYLKEEGIEFDLPTEYSGNDKIVISDDVFIGKVEQPTQPSINEVTEQLAGPYFDTSVYPITGYYDSVDKPQELVKSELKQKIAELRYEKETSGFKITLQGNEVTIDTQRGDDRNIWFQSFVLLPEGTTQTFKFPKEQIWLSLSKTEIAEIVQATVAHVQSAFDWENTKVSEIEAITTKEGFETFYDANIKKTPEIGPVV